MLMNSLSKAEAEAVMDTIIAKNIFFDPMPVLD
ncbi:MAG TPA: hypothetical protein DEF89_20550 [Desulfosporosinus sp.]|nr:hypothetical protein [Desulfosporosinus sp.]